MRETGRLQSLLFVLFQQMGGVPVEVVRVTVYSRHSWVMFMIDLVATCSMRQY